MAVKPLYLFDYHPVTGTSTICFEERFSKRDANICFSFSHLQIFRQIFFRKFSASISARATISLALLLSGLQLLTLFTELCRQLILPICIAQVAEALWTCFARCLPYGGFRNSEHFVYGWKRNRYAFWFRFSFRFRCKERFFSKAGRKYRDHFQNCNSECNFFRKKFVSPLNKEKEKPRYRGFSQPRASVAQAKALT